MTSPDKRAVVAALRKRLQATLDGLRESQKAVQAGAVHPEARQEHPKDTRSTEAGYLARGLAERVETLRDEMKALDFLTLRPFAADDAAAPGALVVLAGADDEPTLCFLAPAGGGERLEVSGHRVLVLTPRSPLGAAIAGRRAGDAIEARLPTGILHAEIDSLA